ncbi:MAG: ATP-dependent helicase HrpB [Candidatus Riflebacteria bacterium]|nr:ATP-dependent helicase HrpB [Candidatus Riflebacteria bacterium]
MTQPNMLPVTTHLPALNKKISESSSLVLVASPGAGKTTVFPISMLDSAWLSGKKIIMLEPRRLAAKAAACRMAALIGNDVGKTVGYQIRFEKKSCSATKLEILTEGLLLRRLQNDPYLDDAACVIFDEFHERNLHSEISLALIREIQQTVRPDLKIVVMSATFDPMPVSKYLGGSTVYEISSPQYSTEFFWQPSPVLSEVPRVVCSTIIEILRTDREANGILSFLPGEAEIFSTMSLLKTFSETQKMLIMPLYGAMPFREQEMAILPQNLRKIVLATNIAETSLTIDGINRVVDSGLCRQMRYDQNTGIERLEYRRISRASADQRAGRASRTSPGKVFRLWSQPEHNEMDAETQPEILRADLSGVLLELSAWGKPDPEMIEWLQKPSEISVKSALNLLLMLKAIDRKGNITAKGRQLIKFPLSPRLAAVVINAVESGIPLAGCRVAAIISERDFIQRNRDVVQADICDRLEIVGNSEKDISNSVFPIDKKILENVRKVADQLFQIYQSLSVSGNDNHNSNLHFHSGRNYDRKLIKKAVLAGFPDRVAKKRNNSWLMTGGRGFRLHNDCNMINSEIIAAISADAGSERDGIIRSAVEVEEKWLNEIFPELISESRNLIWDAEKKTVSARQIRRFCDLVLSETNIAIQPDDYSEISEILAKELSKEMIDSIFSNPDGNSEIITMLRRIELLRPCPESKNFPQIDISWLKGNFREFAYGCRSYSDLKEKSIKRFIEDSLDFRHKELLEKLVPEKIQVPSGSRIKINYPQNDSPYIAVRIQEIFGWKSSPAILNGRMPLVFHLLSPASRPIQITRDLSNFFKTVYPEIRKSMRADYPKHYWPEDPFTALPCRGTKRLNSHI